MKEMIQGQMWFLPKRPLGGQCGPTSRVGTGLEEAALSQTISPSSLGSTTGARSSSLGFWTGNISLPVWFSNLLD